MAFRPSFGYNHGQQQQVPRPGNGQFMQHPQAYPGMMPQGYQMTGQGVENPHGGVSGPHGGVPRPAYPNPGVVMQPPGVFYPNQQMMMPPQGYMVPGMMAPGVIPQQQQMHQVTQQKQQPQTEEERKMEEKLKKERYFQEQKMKLKHFGKGAKPSLSLDMASSLVDSLGGTGTHSKSGPGGSVSHHPPKGAESDSFGDFQHASNSQQENQSDEDDFGDFLQARSTGPVSSSTSTVPSAPINADSECLKDQMEETPSEAAVPQPPQSKPAVKKEISLEDMMLKSTDLSESTKSAKPIHIKKTLNDVKVSQPQGNTKAKVFNASDKSRQWNSAEDFSSLFTLAEIPGGVKPAKSTVENQGVHLPKWCSNPSSIPLLYHQVLEATYSNGAIQTDSLYPILLLSGLDRQALGVIWNMVNKTHPGVLEKHELFMALGLIALHQNKLPVTFEHLYSLQEAPIPQLSPSQKPVEKPPVTEDNQPENPDASDVLSSFSQSVAKEKETFNAHFAREDHTPEDIVQLSEFKSHQPEPPPSNSLEEEFAEFQSSRNTQLSPDFSPFGKLPGPPGMPVFGFPSSEAKPTKSATSPNLKSLSTDNSDIDLEFGDFSSHRATEQVTPFGQFHTAESGGSDSWANFKHASSDPSLPSSGVVDKYAVFKELSEEKSDLDLFGKGNLTVPTIPIKADESDDEGGSALRGMVSESSDEEPFSNFQAASIPPDFQQLPSSGGGTLQGSFAMPSASGSNGLALQSSSSLHMEEFGEFSQSQQDNIPFPQANFDMSANFPKQGTTGWESSLSSNLSNLQQQSKEKPDDFGSFNSQPSVDPSIDKYEALKGLQLEDEKEEEDFGDFLAGSPPKDSGNALTFAAETTSNDLKSAGVNITSNFMPPAGDDSNTLGQAVPPSSVPSIHPGLSGPPLMASGLLGGDRYSEVAGDKIDENRHIREWERCLTSCYSAIQTANNVLNNVSSSSVCKEVTSSRTGSEYFKAIVEVYRVACRVFASIQSRGVETDVLMKLKEDIEKIWTNLAAFLAATPLQLDDSSFVFKTATLRPEPENQDKACGVCLLNVDSRSKAYNRSEDSLKLSYGGRQYHATCANLWVNMVDSLLPALPLEALL